MPKKGGFYSQTPKVPDKKIAGVNPIGSVGIAPTFVGVDTQPSMRHGLGPNTKNVKPLPIQGARRYQHVARHTKLGTPHRIGKK